MKEVLKQLQKEYEETQALINYHEERRDRTARGSASWRCEDSEVQYYKGEANGIKKAIRAIERAGAAI